MLPRAAGSPTTNNSSCGNDRLQTASRQLREAGTKLFGRCHQGLSRPPQMGVDTRLELCVRRCWCQVSGLRCAQFAHKCRTPPYRMRRGAFCGFGGVCAPVSSLLLPDHLHGIYMASTWSYMGSCRCHVDATNMPCRRVKPSTYENHPGLAGEASIREREVSLIRLD